MGMSVWSELDTRIYFSVSTIRIDIMKKYGLNMTKKELAERARNSEPYDQILTGQRRLIGNRRWTNIYRYADFMEEKEGVA